MLEIGWSEIFVVALILIIVVGPKDLPGMLRNFGRMATRIRGMANEFKGQFDDAIREAELDDVRKGLSDVKKLNPTNSLRDAINPIRQFGQDLKSDLQKASESAEKAMAAPSSTPSVTSESVVADAVAPSAAADESVKVNAMTADPGALPVEPIPALSPSAAKESAASVASPKTESAPAKTTKPRTPRKKVEPVAEGTAPHEPVKPKPARKPRASTKTVAVVSVDETPPSAGKTKARKKAEKASDA